MDGFTLLKRITSTPAAAKAAAAWVTGRWPGHWPVQYGDKLLRWTKDGQILESLDGGCTWLLHTDFGRQCHIQGVYEQNGRLFIIIGFRNYQYTLYSLDGVHWRAESA